MIALVILLIAMLGLAGATSFGAIRANADEVQALTAGQEYLEQLRDFIRNSDSAAPLPLPPVVAIQAGQSFVGGTISDPGKFTITNDGCPPVDAGGILRRCTVTVSWAERGAAKSRSVVSYATQQL